MSIITKPYANRVLYTLMLSKNISLNRLAKKVKVNINTLYKVANFSGRVSPAVLKKLEKFFHVPSSELYPNNPETKRGAGKPYGFQVEFKNTAFMELVKENNISSFQQLADKTGTHVMDIYAVAHSQKNRYIKASLIKLEKFFKRPVEDFYLIKKDTEDVLDLDEYKLVPIDEMGIQPAVNKVESDVENVLLATEVDWALGTLMPREEKVLKMRFGIGDPTGYNMTLDEVAADCKVDRTSIRQVEAKALMKLRRPLRNNKLATFLEY